MSDYRNKLRDIMDLVQQYGDERSCVTYNGWHRIASPEDLLKQIEWKLRYLTPFNPQPGDVVEINGAGDLMFDRSFGKHIGESVTVIKRCKSGLYQVQTSDGPKSFAKRNLDPQRIL
jgi:hypothetical protein